MTDLLLPAGMTSAEALEVLSARLRLRERGTERRRRRFYDTFDGLMRADGLAFVYEAGRAAAIALADGAEQAAAPVAELSERVFAGDLEPGALRELVADAIEVRALLPLVEVESTEWAFGVLDDTEKTVVRLTLDEPAALASPHRRLPLAARVRLTPVRGYEAEHARTRGILVDGVGLRAAARSVLDEAVLATGGTPGGVSAKIEVALAPDERADVAVVSVLRRLADVMAANLPGTIADIDSEFLHDYRVSLRRSRAVLREFKRVFPPEQIARFRTELRWLQRATGDARDLDVYVLEFDELTASLPEPADLAPLLRVLQERRAVAHREMVRALRSDRAIALAEQWPAFLGDLIRLPVEERPAAVRPIGELAGERIVKVYRRMVKMGRAIDDSSPGEALHELRKKGKELRYLLELFATPLHPGDVVKPLVRALKSLQDTLGRHQDREVQIASLRALRDDVGSLPGGPAALMAMGVLVERLGEDERTARAEFAARFAEFSSGGQRSLVKETFSA